MHRRKLTCIPKITPIVLIYLRSIIFRPIIFSIYIYIYVISGVYVYVLLLFFFGCLFWSFPENPPKQNGSVISKLRFHILDIVTCEKNKRWGAGLDNYNYITGFQLVFCSVCSVYIPNNPILNGSGFAMTMFFKFSMKTDTSGQHFLWFPSLNYLRWFLGYSLIKPSFGVTSAD